MRAIALRVDDVIAVAGFATAGTRVDLMLSMQPPGSSEMITRTIMQNLEIATHGTVYVPDPQGNAVPVGVLTLYVTPDQAVTLSLAQKQGQIQLALRNRLDVREARTAVARVSQLLSGGAAPATRSTTRSAPPPATTATGNTLEVIRGSQRSIVRFGRGGGNQ
jgi:pilus assembly protein CpaB